MGVITRSFPPHLYPVEYFVSLHGASPLPPSGPEALPGWRPGERVGHSIPPAKLGRILAHFDKEQIEEYSSWPIERRLQWLFLANKMRRFLPRKTIELQEAFRQGKI